VENNLGPAWVYTVGLIPLQVFMRYKGELYHPQDRDHYYAQVTCPSRYWVFLYKDFDESAIDLQDQQASRDQMHHSNVPAIHITEYQKLIQLYRHLKNHSESAQCRVAEPRKTP
jgi:hypothetical protein